MEITELLLREDVRSLLKVIASALVLVLVWIPFYRAIKADEDAELSTLKTQAVQRAPLRIVTEQDFDDVREAMQEDERLAVQRRAEGLGWFDTDEEFQRETA